MAAIESEIFLLGIWKDYNDLEENLSMPELTATLIAARDIEHRKNKFIAAIQGVNIDENEEENSSNAWEDMKARVFSGGLASNSDDIVSLQGINAVNAGFGIGMGLDYQTVVG